MGGGVWVVRLYFICSLECVWNVVYCTALAQSDFRRGVKKLNVNWLAGFTVNSRTLWL